jgi:glucokinase
VAARSRPRYPRVLLRHRQHRLGCGIITNGQLVTGRAGYAGELGRSRIPNIDGSRTELEQISSGTAIAARARALIAAGTPTAWPPSPPTDITAGTVGAAADAGDHAARDIFTTATTTLGIQLANLTRLVDPESIALGGGVSLAATSSGTHSTPRWKEPLAQDSIPIPRLVEAELRGDAGLHSAAIELLNHHEPAPA